LEDFNYVLCALMPKASLWHELVIYKHYMNGMSELPLD